MRTEHARVTSPRKHPTNILRTLHLRHFYASSTMPKECAKWSVHRQANLDSFSLRHGMRQARCCKRLLATPYDGPPVVSPVQRENQQQRQQQQKQHPQQQQHRRQRRTMQSTVPWTSRLLRRAPSTPSTTVYIALLPIASGTTYQIISTAQISTPSPCMMPTDERLFGFTWRFPRPAPVLGSMR